ncbi:hypothetical protein IFM89_018191 [Coptis chinensis]|uniref:F-box protein n=1 Tax=Coptis chinensis TaxID=261450 RepID=A0A835LVH6_9MAGN|nr:hypothetical protein IFM89_018191 [Coptis chinensis]
MASRWSQIPDHLLELITILLNLDDLVRFSCVCRPWRSHATPLLVPNLNLIPWLIVPYGNYTCKIASNICDKTLGFFNIQDGKTYKIDTPQLADRRICGSCSGGWLVTVHENSEIQVYHPFSKKVIQLPPVTKLPGVTGCFIGRRNELYYVVPNRPHFSYRVLEMSTTTMSSSEVRERYIYKAIMSPSTGIVMVIQGRFRTLAVCRVGRVKKWYSVKGDIEGMYNDIAIYNREFYAVNDFGQVFVVSSVDSGRPVIKLVISGPYGFDYCKSYLVECKGELLLLRRVCNNNCVTACFMINKLDFSGPRWVEVKHLNRGYVDDVGKDCAMFVGYNDSFCISTSSFTGYEEHSVYFTGDILKRGLSFASELQETIYGDLGVFNLKNDVIKRFFSKSFQPSPIWFTTNSFSSIQFLPHQIP